ncbi:hypothetical protein WG66_003524 [Moniliophthora roreri]|nr:hypothetical protein WG66_003524 [Moniliophthora roreri]
MYQSQNYSFSVGDPFLFVKILHLASQGLDFSQILLLNPSVGLNLACNGIVTKQQCFLKHHPVFGSWKCALRLGSIIWKNNRNRKWRVIPL